MRQNADIINMRTRKRWFRPDTFEMDDTVDKPKTFAEIEGEKIATFMVTWAKWSLIPASIAGGYYALPWVEQTVFSKPLAVVVMFLGVWWMANLPNLAIILIWSLALGLVTYGRE